MKGLVKKLLTAVAGFSLVVTPTINAFAVQPTQKLLSLGASLQGAQITQTRTLLGATDVPEANTIYVDGPTVNRYLGDGSTANTIVYSSALIEPQSAGHGVQVQIVTPHNITLVTPITYQNAAITSGAKDISIKIATVAPVTGEGALAGVYALLEKSGTKINKQSIKVAEKEIKIVERVKKDKKLSDIQVNQIIADIKKEITIKVTNNITIDANQAKIIIHTILEKYQIDPNLVDLTELVQFSIDFSKTDAAKNKNTVDQLVQSVDKAIWNESKRAELQHYMKIWGEAMGQNYKEHSPDNPANYYGLAIPNEVLDKIAINDQKVTAEWSTQGITPNVYNIVAAYMETKDQSEMNVHLYLFAIYNGEPVVLHTQQNQGTDTGWVYFKPTENVELRNNFAEIVKGTTADYLTLPAKWNDQKSVELSNYMQIWGNAMGQRYAGYSSEATGNYYGLAIPTEILDKIAVNDQKVAAEWSTTGNKPGVYNIVGTYMELKDSDAMDIHLYLFALYNGEPVVLHTQQNQGTDTGWVYFKPTENVDLRNAFTRIVNGEPGSNLPVPNVTQDAKWNASKQEKLRTFMKNWEQGMGQSYTEYTPDNPGDFHGAPIPSYPIEHFAWGDKLINAQWSTDGSAVGVYNIVACYKQNAVDEESTMFPHLYLFALVGDEPMVFHSQQNQGGMPGDGFYFKPTENVDLANGFKQIVNE
ncbi:DUF1002 domain-containing protein [Aerococcaceae bacterium NML171108]|nr:DUF1002 domain-containing protein [Aerococcaceae bacterium NML171108]